MHSGKTFKIVKDVLILVHIEYSKLQYISFDLWDENHKNLYITHRCMSCVPLHHEKYDCIT